jgi:MoxR-like ATPase
MWEVSPSELYHYLKEDLRLGEKCPVIFIWGQPGIGKTMIVQQLAAELGYHLAVLEVSTIHPYALSGIPVPNIPRKMVEMLPLKFIAELREHEDDDCIVFLDDFGAADPYQQRIALSLTTYRAIGDAKLPKRARLIIATNREEDAAYVITPSYAILNRVKHYNLSPKFEDWVAWMHKNYPEKEELLQIVSGFLASHPQNFCWTPEEAIKRKTAAYPTPRSWTNFIANTDALSDIKELARRCSFWVGKETAAEFYKFCLISEEEMRAIMKNPQLLKRKTKGWQILALSHIIDTYYKQPECKGDVETLEVLLSSVSNDVLAAILPRLSGSLELEKLRARLSLQIVGKNND